MKKIYWDRWCVVIVIISRIYWSKSEVTVYYLHKYRFLGKVLNETFFLASFPRTMLGRDTNASNASAICFGDGTFSWQLFQTFISQRLFCGG